MGATQSFNRMRRSPRHVGRGGATVRPGAGARLRRGVREDRCRGDPARLLTLDDYVPGRSDIDLLVVIDDPASDAGLAALADAMASRRAEAPGPVDLRLVTRQVAASPTPAPPLEAYLRLTPAPGSG